MTNKVIASNIEIWKPVKGFDGYYEVSSFGNVRSLDRQILYNTTMGWKKGTQLKNKTSKNGYVLFSLCKKGVVKYRTAHSLVMETFVGPRPDGWETRHLNGKRTDNRLENLCYGTVSQNQRDRILHGTHTYGEKRSNSILTEKMVIEARKRYVRRSRTCGASALAREFGVTYSALYDAIMGLKNWKYLNERVSPYVFTRN